MLNNEKHSFSVYIYQYNYYYKKIDYKIIQIILENKNYFTTTLFIIIIMNYHMVIEKLLLL